VNIVWIYKHISLNPHILKDTLSLFQLFLISLLLLYRGGLTQPLDDTAITELPEINLQTTVAALEANSGVADDDAVQSDGEDSKADQWEGEDGVEDNAVQSEDEGRAGNSFQTRGRKSMNCFSFNYVNMCHCCGLVTFYANPVQSLNVPY
jgi:hypothetical protein